MVFLPYGRQQITDDDIAAVVKVLKSDYLTTGPLVELFETAFQDCVQVPFATSCSSGTAALHLAALALDLQPGDYAIVPAVTFAATANAVRFVGADVLFCDVDPDTGLISLDHLQMLLQRHQDKNIKAIFPVHLNGQCADLDQIEKIARHYNVSIVEDACHALGTHYTINGQKFITGSCAHSDMTVFSFHPVKTVACGEGGMLTTRNNGLDERLKKFRSHGITRNPAHFLLHEKAFDKGQVNPWYYEMQDLGYNYRLSDIHCALGLSQLQRLTSLKAKRQHLFQLYQTYFADISPAIKLMDPLAGNDPCWHLCVALFDFETLGLSRRHIMSELATQNIGTQVHYMPVPYHPYYQKRYDTPLFLGAESYYNRCLSLPLHCNMEERDIAHIAKSLKQLLAYPAKIPA